MTKKMMWNMMWKKAKYGIKSSLLFIIITVLFIGMFLTFLITSDSEEIHEAQSIIMIAFLYIPISVNQSFQVIEYSKCYYLIPRTAKERKQYLQFQNIVKMILSILVSTILLAVGMVIRPQATPYLLVYYLICSVSVTLITGISGFTTYYYVKKKVSYQRYWFRYVLTVISVLIVMLPMMYINIASSYRLGIVATVVSVIASIIYSVYYWIRFQKVNVNYENIDKNEEKFTKRFQSSIM